MVAWSIQTFARMPEVCDLVVTAEPDCLDAMRALVEQYACGVPATVIRGGATRQASVRAALAQVPLRCEGVFVHDGARPLVRAAEVREGMRAVRSGVGSLLAVPVVDTLKVVGAGNVVSSTLRCERGEALWAAQTPQFAMTADMMRAHEEGVRAGAEVTDDAALLERCGLAVVVVPGSAGNFKVTHPSDEQRAETLLRMKVAEEEACNAEAAL